MKASERRVRIFADGGDLEVLRALGARDDVQGFTTNATLMRRAGVRDARAFAREVIAIAAGRPVSLGVMHADVAGMERVARELATAGSAVHAKIPVTTVRGEPTTELVRRLAADGVHVNVTAVTTAAQIEQLAGALRGGASSYVSILAGRIADAGVDPRPMVADAVRALADAPEISVMWASAREVFNVAQADAAGAHVITLTADLLAKLDAVGEDLDVVSLRTVRALQADADGGGYAD